MSPPAASRANTGAQREDISMTRSGASAPIDPRQWRAVLGSVAIAALGYLVFSLWGGWQDVWHAVRSVGWTGTAVLLGLSGVNYGLRFVRWQVFLRALGSPQPWRPSLAIYLAGFALTTTPGKVGEAVRSLFLKQRGMSHPDSIAAFVSERLSDLLAVALLCAFGWNVYPPIRPLLVVGIGALVGVLLLISRERLLNRARRALVGRPGRSARLFDALLELLLTARRCHAPGVLLVASVLSVVAWSAEAFAFWLLLRWLDTGTAPGFAIFTYATGLLAGALSFMPGGLGGTEAAMIALLLSNGVAHATAITATVFIRLTTLWFAVAIGAPVLLRLLPLLSGPAPTRVKVGVPGASAP